MGREQHPRAALFGVLTMTLFSSLYTGRLDRELGTDDSTVLFTTARRKAAVNEGQAEFADLTECLQRTATVSMRGGSSGVGPLSLPTAEYDLTSTTVIPDGDFVRFSKDQVQFIYTDGSSNVTIITGDDLPRRDVPWLNRFVPGWQQSTTASSAATGWSRTCSTSCRMMTVISLPSPVRA